MEFSNLVKEENYIKEENSLVYHFLFKQVNSTFVNGEVIFNLNINLVDSILNTFNIFLNYFFYRDIFFHVIELLVFRKV